MFMLRMGVDPELVKIWYDAHVETVCTARKEGLRFKVFFQRKSGDASTAFGNTLINLLFFFHLMGDRPYYAFVAIGDDNNVLHPPGMPPMTVAQKTWFSELFNVEVKVNENLVPYFAGHFICVDCGVVVLVPDPMKLLDKMGRQYSDKRVLKDLFISRHDQVTRMLAPEFRWQLLKGIYLMYGHPCPEAVLDALAMAVNKSKRFVKIWNMRRI